MSEIIIPEDLSRRTFIKGISSFSVGVLASFLFGGCEFLQNIIENRPVRRRLRENSPEINAVLATYAEAVEIMKNELVQGDKRRWIAISIIHGEGQKTNFCEHSSDHFLPWHRAYLYYFERICRDLTGDLEFALPYWNWNQDKQMHTAFLDGSSPLFNNNRESSSVLGSELVSNLTMNTILNDSNFYSFTNQLEMMPHDSVHGIIGGTMSTASAPRDPIFWMHHAMVDYCWTKWNIELENNNPNDINWIEKSWDHFVDMNGELTEIRTFDTILMPLLSYQYESSPIGGDLPITLDLSTSSNRELKKVEARLRKGADISFDIRKKIPLATTNLVSLNKPLSIDAVLTSQDFKRILESKTSEEQIFISVQYAKLPPVNDFYVRVFINLPSASKNTPINSIHYAGSFAFFGTEPEDTTKNQSKHDSHSPPKFLVNATRTIVSLRRGDFLRDFDSISIQLVAVPMREVFDLPDAQLILNGIDILITPVVSNSSN